jgi:hypothetical protein
MIGSLISTQERKVTMDTATYSPSYKARIRATKKVVKGTNISQGER